VALAGARARARARPKAPLFSFHYTMLRRVIIVLIIRSKGRAPLLRLRPPPPTLPLPSPPPPSNPYNWPWNLLSSCPAFSKWDQRGRPATRRLAATERSFGKRRDVTDHPRRRRSRRFPCRGITPVCQTTVPTSSSISSAGVTHTA